MLIGNQNVLSRHPGRDIGGGATGLGYERKNRSKSSMSRGSFCSATWEPKSGRPDGYRPGYAWILPQEAGGMSSRNLIVGRGSLADVNVASGQYMAAALSGSGSLSATGGLIVQIVAALSGSGSVTTANVNAVLQIIAALTGSGSLSATSTALGHFGAGLSGTGTVSVTPSATGNVAADITPFTELSPESLAASVWSSLAAAYNDAGTMGEKLNDAGSAANPWTEEIETGYTAEELLRLIAASLLGKLDGADTTTITMRDVNDTIDRIIATVDGDGNRDLVTLDAS